VVYPLVGWDRYYIQQEGVEPPGSEGLGGQTCESYVKKGKGVSSMAHEESMYIVSRSVEEDKADLVTVHEVFVVESCPATCPTCQQTCEYPQGHPGLHQCPNRHEWLS
jgi:hypothetical protein